MVEKLDVGKDMSNTCCEDEGHDEKREEGRNQGRYREINTVDICEEKVGW